MGFSLFVACELGCWGVWALKFSNQGLKLRPLHCKVDSWPLDRQGSPCSFSGMIPTSYIKAEGLDAFPFHCGSKVTGTLAISSYAKKSSTNWMLPLKTLNLEWPKGGAHALSQLFQLWYHSHTTGFLPLEQSWLLSFPSLVLQAPCQSVNIG